MKTGSTSTAAVGAESRPRKLRIGPASVEWRIVAMALFVSAGCYFGSELGAWVRFPGQGNAVLFPPYAVLTTALVFSPPRTWWIFLLASLAGHFTANSPHWPTSWVLLSELANYSKALLAAFAIRQLNRGPRLNSLRRMSVFFAFAVFLAPAIAAFIGAAIVTHYDAANSFWLAWRAWLLSNALTAVMLIPVLLSGLTDFPKWLRTVSIARGLELMLLAVSLFGVCLFVLVHPQESFINLPPKLYCLLPILLWASVRFGTAGAAMAVLLVGSMAIAGAMRGQGPFGATTEDLLSLQLFVIVLSFPVLFLAALIEDRNSVADALREREERIGLAAETANFALWAIDFERGESWMSEKGREMFGFAPNDLLSRETFLERVHPEDRHLVDEAIDAARAGSKTFEIECRLSHLDGETRWLITRGRYLRDERGKVTELIGVAIDVTGKVQANLELHRRQQEVARLGRVALMGELTASLAHELNQPLAAIASYAAAGRRFLAGGTADPQLLNELLAEVSTDARRAGDVIRGIRHLVRKGEETRCVVDLNASLREVLRLLRSDLVEHGTTAETNLATDPLLVRADPVQLQQVLLNLLMNAVEAMHETPAASRRILISTHASDGRVEVSVRDYGKGLPKDNPNKVFTKFFSTKPNGMGMGLAIVQSIIETHDGDLRAENLADGARFFFRLPAS